MLTQIQELRSTSSVLFACLHRFSQSSQDEIDEELINDLIGWTFDIVSAPLYHLDPYHSPQCHIPPGLTLLILLLPGHQTGRLVRQCRLEDHLYVAMQLLRLPFSLKYSTLHPALAGLLQPPALDIAWARANSQPAAFIEEPEVELRASLVALCLRTPVW
ncbi:unnamed protein product [Dibothriocephalus latus]|uniref:Uncharacterized protein n=1 Tax=Dibothriocephalus latus TaxID=60516 RepID=A0A3P6TSU0_DIBLA|nr:unnamed protein product [Dibothriocephalus latus]